MGLIGRADVTPYNAQVELSDPNARDYPQWRTGNEAVVALPDSVAVATQGVDSGKVVVEVWYGEIPSEEPTLSEALFDDEFVTTGDRVVIGNTVGNEFYVVDVPAGRHRLQVFASPAGGLARKVYFVLGQLRSQDSDAALRPA